MSTPTPAWVSTRTGARWCSTTGGTKSGTSCSANALFWIEEFHLDGLRVDAVASMLYLDYSRKEGEWITNRFGGRENLEAIDFIKESNEVVYRHHPSVLLVAEESTSSQAVSRPTYLGGLGFGFKWNMGWMHDTLIYFSKDPVHRRYHHHELTFALLYAFSENFILPLSHDEVAHGKGSLLGKMPGDRWQQFANLRALLTWMWAHPGRQLLFMGGEIAQDGEWRHDSSLDWHLLDYPEHAGVQALVRALNTVYRHEPALWEQDFDWPGFRWINPNDSEQQRTVVPPLPNHRWAQHRLRRQPHASAPPRLPHRAPATGTLGRNPQLRQREVRRHQHTRRRRHRRAHRLERPRLLRHTHVAAPWRPVARPRARHQPARCARPSNMSRGRNSSSHSPQACQVNSSSCG